VAQQPKIQRTVRGFSIVSVLFTSIVVAAIAVLAMRVFPSVNEYFTIVKAINSISKKARSAEEVKNLFGRQAEVEYSISSISAADLLVAKQQDKLVISFAYNKEIPIFGPVYLLIKYQGRSV
jgi:hypothetical protein